MELWPFDTNKSISIDELVNEIKSTPLIEGITISGGEPLDQAKIVFELIKKVKELKLTIVLFTGYTKSEIQNNPLKNAIFNSSDIIITGRYEIDKNSICLRWRGSSNQEIYFNNQKYLTEFSNAPELSEFEVHFDNSGEIILTGFPDPNFKELI